jgi:hypothetical protein
MGALAKVYEVKEGWYIKVCDTHEESVDFDLNRCFFPFDLSKIC